MHAYTITTHSKHKAEQQQYNTTQTIPGALAFSLLGSVLFFFYPLAGLDGH